MNTTWDHANQPAKGQKIAGPGGIEDQAAARRADERAQAARSVDCPCQARAGAPCGPSGDHLARYLRAGQSGALTRQALTDVIAGLDVIAPRVLIQPPGERTARAGGLTTAAQMGAGVSKDRTGTTAESVPAGRSSEQGLAGEARRGHGEVSSICAREARELEAGT